MNVLLTGAFGNIGTGCLPELIRQGHRVRALDLRTPENERAARQFGEQIEPAWGDIRDAESVRAAVAGQQAVVHLAAIIPPESNEKPDLARAVNVDGTRHVIQACQQVDPAPRLLFASTFDLFGYTQSQPPPRRVTDPISATSIYTEHKLACEGMVRESGLTWAIFRFADVPLIGLRSAHPIMYEIGLDNRMEVVHHADAGLAVTNALSCDQVWGQVMLIGGGPDCQVTYREYVSRILKAMGLEMPPEKAFSGKEYRTDWLDTEESQRLLTYQRHTFDDIVHEIAGMLGARRFVLPLIRPLIQRSMLKLSPYWQD